MTTTDDEGVPLFGAGVDHRATKPFQIEVHHYPTNATWTETFTAKEDPGPSPVLNFLRAAGDENAMAQAGGSLIINALVDYDGKPAAAVGDVAPIPEIADEAWSSKARFGFYTDSPHHHMASSVIVDLATWIAQTAFGRGGVRPTRSSPASSGGQTSTRRSSPRAPAKKA